MSKSGVLPNDVDKMVTGDLIKLISPYRLDVYYPLPTITYTSLSLAKQGVARMDEKQQQQQTIITDRRKRTTTAVVLLLFLLMPHP